MKAGRIVIAGGSGFIGGALAGELMARGYEVVILTRTPGGRPDGAKEVAWNGVQAGAWAMWLEGAAAMVNLAGRNINCPHTPENLREIAGSRVQSVRTLAAAMKLVRQPPAVWVQASAVGFYGDTGNLLCDESAPAGQDALAAVCQEWEGGLWAAELPPMRRVILRIGMVLGRDGGALPVFSRMVRCFLGGTAGNGRQYVSWIHLADLTAMFATVIANERFTGVFNAVSPGPVRNAELMRELRRAWHRPWSPPAPALAVKLGAPLMGSEGSLALISQGCVPDRFTEAGFQFRFPELRGALDDLVKNAGKLNR